MVSRGLSTSVPTAPTPPTYRLKRGHKIKSPVQVSTRAKCLCVQGTGQHGHWSYFKMGEEKAKELELRLRFAAAGADTAPGPGSRGHWQQSDHSCVLAEEGRSAWAAGAGRWARAGFVEGRRREPRPRRGAGYHGGWTGFLD